MWMDDACGEGPQHRAEVGFSFLFYSVWCCEDVLKLMWLALNVEIFTMMSSEVYYIALHWSLEEVPAAQSGRTESPDLS